VFSEDNDTVTFCDDTGVIQRLYQCDFEKTAGHVSHVGQTSGMSHWIEHPVRDLASWKTIYEKRFRQRLEDRLIEGSDRQEQDLQAGDEQKVISGTASNFPFFGTYGGLQHIIGAERLNLFYDEP